MQSIEHLPTAKSAAIYVAVRRVGCKLCFLIRPVHGNAVNLRFIIIVEAVAYPKQTRINSLPGSPASPHDPGIYIRYHRAGRRDIAQTGFFYAGPPAISSIIAALFRNHQRRSAARPEGIVKAGAYGFEIHHLTALRHLPVIMPLKSSVAAEHVVMPGTADTVPCGIVPGDIHLVILPVQHDHVPRMCHRCAGNHIAFNPLLVQKVFISQGIAVAHCGAIGKNTVSRMGLIRNLIGTQIQILLVVLTVDRQIVVQGYDLFQITHTRAHGCQRRIRTAPPFGIVKPFFIFNHYHRYHGLHG